jgi:hypothetical protein
MPRTDPGFTAEHKAVRRTVLPGGLRVVTEYLPAVRSVSVGVWVGVGSRDEGASVAGAAHFLEHLLFKATPTRTAVDIAQAMDAVGGELNAFTAKEHTCYYAHVLDSDLELAVELVADVVLNGRCAAEDVDIERDVVLEEIAMRDDDPEDALGDVFLGALFGGHPLGRPVIGTPQSVSAMTRNQLHSFHVRRYTPERMVVAVAGNVDHGEVVALVGENGADKTTLVKLLTRLYDPDEGRILLDGHDLREYDLDALRGNMGVIFQDFVRYNLSAADNIAVGRIAARDDRARDEIDRAQASVVQSRAKPASRQAQHPPPRRRAEKDAEHEPARTAAHAKSGEHRQELADRHRIREREREHG